MQPKDLRYLLTYDSAHLRFPFKVEEWEHGVSVNGKKIRLFSEKDPANIPWAENGVVTVCESTGKFLTTEKCQAHIKGGAKKVVISAPPKDSRLQEDSRMPMSRLKSKKKGRSKLTQHETNIFHNQIKICP